jgi:arginine:agmatine antiporter
LLEEVSGVPNEHAGAHPGRKMTLLMATMLVAGNMIGTGLFLLPASLATVGSISIFGWVLGTVGAAALGIVFAKLGELDPQPGGPYAYARSSFGPYIGFQTNYIYWFANWIGNVAIAVSVTGCLSELIPVLKTPPISTVATILVIWIFTGANIVGARFVGWLETWTMSLALIPILGIALMGWFWFNGDTFTAAWNVSGGSSFHAISRSASMALWAFMGIESAAVSAGNIENPKRNIPIATLAGLGISAVVYILCSTVIMGIIPNAELQKSAAPFAVAAGIAFGKLGIVIVSLCAILKASGSLGGWMLLVAESGHAAADDGMFPRIFGRLNHAGVPVSGLIIVGLLMTAVVLFTVSPTIASQFSIIIDLTVVLSVLPYLYSSIALWKVCYEHGYRLQNGLKFIVIGLLAATYCLWVIGGSMPESARNAMIAVFVSVPLFAFFARSMKEAELRKQAKAAQVGVEGP